MNAQENQLNLQLIAILIVTIRHARDRDRLITEEEFAYKVGVTPQTARAWRHKGDIVGVRLPGDDVRYTYEQYESFIRDCAERERLALRAKKFDRVKTKAA